MANTEIIRQKKTTTVRTAPANPEQEQKAERMRELKKAKYFFRKCGQEEQLKANKNVRLQNYMSIKQCNTVISVHLGNDSFDATYCRTDGNLMDLLYPEQVEHHFYQKRAGQFDRPDGRGNGHIDFMKPPAMHRMVTKDGSTIGEVQKKAAGTFLYMLFSEILGAEMGEAQASMTADTEVRENETADMRVSDGNASEAHPSNLNSPDTGTPRLQTPDITTPDLKKTLLLLCIPDSEPWQSQREQFADFICQSSGGRLPREHILILPEAECTYHYVCDVKKMGAGPVKILNLGHTSFSAATCSGDGRLRDEKTFLLGGNRIESAALKSALERRNKRVGSDPICWDDIANLNEVLYQVRQIKEERCLQGGRLGVLEEIELKLKSHNFSEKIAVNESDFDFAFKKEKYKVCQPGFPEMEDTYWPLVEHFLEESAKDSDRVFLTGGMASEVRNSNSLQGIINKYNITLLDMDEVTSGETGHADYNKRITEGGIACIRSAFGLERGLKKLEDETIPEDLGRSNILKKFSKAHAVPAAESLWRECYLPAMERYKEYPEDICFGTGGIGFDSYGDVTFYSLLKDELAKKILNFVHIFSEMPVDPVGDFSESFQSTWKLCAEAGFENEEKEGCKYIILSCLKEKVPACVCRFPGIISDFDMNCVFPFIPVEITKTKTATERANVEMKLKKRDGDYINRLTHAISGKYEEALKNSDVSETIAKKLTDYLLDRLPLE